MGWMMFPDPHYHLIYKDGFDHYQLMKGEHIGKQLKPASITFLISNKTLSS
jgi:hypothetical protein